MKMILNARIFDKMKKEEKDPRDLTGRRIVNYSLQVVAEPNNVYNKEQCILCKKWFEVSPTLYSIPHTGHICYDCIWRMKKKKILRRRGR